MSSVEEMVVNNIDWINRKARTYYDDHSDADDLAGETILKCLSHSAAYNGRDFKPWVTAIMCNTYITQYNRKKKVLFSPLGNEDMTHDSCVSDTASSVKNILSVARSMLRMSRSVECVMLYAKGYTYAEISKKMGVSSGAVCSHISIGRKMLRVALEECG